MAASVSDALATHPDLGSWLSRRYLIALAFLTSLVVGGYVARKMVEPRAEYDNHLIDVAGQQQVLAERMLALGVLAATSEGADRLRDLADLTETKRAWDTEYQQLVVHGMHDNLVDDGTDVMHALDRGIPPARGSA